MSLCGLSWPVAWNEACVAWRLRVKHWVRAPRTDVLNKEVLLVVARHFSGWALLLRLRHPSAAPGTQGSLSISKSFFLIWDLMLSVLGSSHIWRCDYAQVNLWINYTYCFSQPRQAVLMQTQYMWHYRNGWGKPEHLPIKSNLGSLNENVSQTRVILSATWSYYEGSAGPPDSETDRFSALPPSMNS